MAEIAKRRNFSKGRTTICDGLSLEGLATRMKSKSSQQQNWQTTWSENAIDLLRVHKVVQQLYLVLQGSNEALLRVGVELLTDKRCQKVLQWNQEWYDHDDSRTWFREKVQHKLKNVLQVVAYGEAQHDDTDYSEVMQSLKRQLSAKEASLSEARDKIRQLTVGKADGSSVDALDRIVELEEAARKQQAAMRDLYRQAEEQAKLLAEAEVKYKEQLESAQRAEAMAADSASQLSKALAEVQQYKERKSSNKNIPEVTTCQACEGCKPEVLVCAKCRSIAAVVAASPLQPPQPEPAADTAELDAVRKRAAAAERKLREAEAEMKNLGRQLAAKNADCPAEPPKKATPKKNKASTSLGCSQTDGFWQDSGDEVQMLRTENKRLKVALEELQAKLKALVGACEESGMPDVQKMLKKIGLETIVDAVNVFDRLYRDAMARIHRVRKREDATEMLEELLPGVDLLHELGDSTLVNQLPVLSASSSKGRLGQYPGGKIASLPIAYPDHPPVVGGMPMALSSTVIQKSERGMLAPAETATKHGDVAGITGFSMSSALSSGSTLRETQSSSLPPFGRAAAVTSEGEAVEWSMRRKTQMRQSHRRNPGLDIPEGSFGFAAAGNARNRAREQNHMKVSASLPDLSKPVHGQWNRTDALAAQQMVHHISGAEKLRHYSMRDGPRRG